MGTKVSKRLIHTSELENLGVLNISAADKCSKESLEIKLENDIRKLADFEKSLSELLQASISV